MQMTAKEKTEQALKLYDFIYDYCYRSSAVFDKQYPEYTAWRLTQTRREADVLDFITQTFVMEE